MVERVYITKGEAQSMGQELADMRHRPKDGVRVIDGRSYNGRVSFDRHPELSGASVYGSTGELGGPNIRGVVVANPDPTLVSIGNMTMKREAAVAAGLIPHPDAYVQPGQSAIPFVASPEMQTQQQEQQPEASASPLEAAGDTALTELAAAFQGDVYSTALEAASSGDFDSVAREHGLDQAKVSAVIAGATAKADRVIAETGIDTALMSEILDSNDLADARRAVVSGENNRLIGIATKAAHKLSAWPSRNPEGFRAWFSANVDADYDMGPRGEFLVKTSQGLLPWASVVHMGGLKRG